MVRVQGNILVSYRNYDSSKPIFSRTGINTRLKWTATIGARGISHSVRVERSRLLVQLSAFGFEWLKEIAFLAVKCHQKRAWGIKWPLCFCFVCLKSPHTHTAAVISQERVTVLFKVTGWWDENGWLLILIKLKHFPAFYMQVCASSFAYPHYYWLFVSFKGPVCNFSTGSFGMKWSKIIKMDVVFSWDKVKNKLI